VNPAVSDWPDENRPYTEFLTVSTRPASRWCRRCARRSGSRATGRHLGQQGPALLLGSVEPAQRPADHAAAGQPGPPPGRHRPEQGVPPAGGLRRAPARHRPRLPGRAAPTGGRRHRQRRLGRPGQPGAGRAAASGRCTGCRATARTSTSSSGSGGCCAGPQPSVRNDGRAAPCAPASATIRRYAIRSGP
jgi:hypothetical protein